jgi:hypothetical protein
MATYLPRGGTHDRRVSILHQQLAPVAIKLPKVIVSEYSVLSVNIRPDNESDSDDKSGVVIYSDESSSEEEEESEELLLCNEPPSQRRNCLKLQVVWFNVKGGWEANLDTWTC